MREEMRPALGWAGPAAAVLFATALIGFAAARGDDYSHATKAVSELGAVGAPGALAFNLLGFVLPGLLVMALAAGLRRVLGTRGGPLLLALSGLCFAGAGVFPADLAARSGALTMAHATLALLSGLAFAAAVFPLGAAMRRDGRFGWLAAATPWFVLFLVANLVWQVLWQATGLVLPGWGQRTAFGGYFLWAALAGWRVTRLGRTSGGPGAVLAA